MRRFGLYARSRHLPAAFGTAAAAVLLVWALTLVSGGTGVVEFPVVVLTVLLAVAAVTATLAGPFDELDRGASLPWPVRRAGHLLALFAAIVALFLVTLPTGARFEPVGSVVRDAAGLLGLTAGGAVVAGAGKAWFVPLGWTLAALLMPPPDGTAGTVLTWQVQEAGSGTAAATAALLAVGGLASYAIVGPDRP